MERTGAALSWRSSVGPALAIWWASRAALFVVVVLTGYVLALPGPTRILAPGGWLLERFVWWDSFHFLRIADRGYLPPGLPCCDQAFFPGYPFATRAMSVLTGGSTVLAGLLVTQLAASVAVVLLHRLAAESVAGDGTVAGRTCDPDVGRTAVLLLAVSPFSIFLSSVYSESLFLAACLGAWLAGSHRRWWLAGLLAAVAAAVRINGLFLAAALAVMYLGQLRAQGRRLPRPDVLALALPAAVVAGYFGYLRARTGSWNNWQQAQVTSWDRHVAWPWQGLQAGWQSFVTAPSHDLVISRGADLVVAVGGLLLLGVLLVRRRWAEATYIALSVGVLVSSTMIVSSPRYALTWFPLYLMAARASVRPAGRWIRGLALTLGPPLLAVTSITFSMHLWTA